MLRHAEAQGDDSDPSGLVLRQLSRRVLERVHTLLRRRTGGAALAKSLGDELDDEFYSGTDTSACSLDELSFSSWLATLAALCAAEAEASGGPLVAPAGRAGLGAGKVLLTDQVTTKTAKSCAALLHDFAIEEKL